MDTTVLIALVAALLSVASAVVSMWFARRAWSADSRKDVDELAATVERFARVARRETMRRVRGAAGSLPASGDDGSPPPELVAAPAQPLTKSELRARLLRRA